MAGHICRSMILIIFSLFAIQANAIEFKGEEYELYIGDVNGDGLNDAYLKVPDTFILIHGDISVPILLDSPIPSYLIASVDVSSPYYAEPVIDESIDISQLIKSTEDASLVDLNGDGIPELQISSPLLVYAFAINGENDQFVAISEAPPIVPDYYSNLPSPESFIQPQHNETVGSVSGQYEVLPDGTANYTIPIDIDGGIRGMQPNLSLSYNSDGGNGALGVGWSINGSSAIVRCPNSRVRQEEVDPVDFEADDKFCLDGQRLVVTSGIYGDHDAIYKKENDDGTTVQSLGSAGTGPLYFKVWTPDSLIHYYGSEIHSRVYAVDRPEVAIWAKSRSDDRYGNYLTWRYYQPPGSGNFRPERIDYTGNISAGVSPMRSVRFEYLENRTDIKRAYMGGSYAEISWLLGSVEIYSDTTKIKEYKLDYIQGEVAPYYNKLSTVQLCSGADICLAPTQIVWSSEQFGAEFDWNAYRHIPGSVNNISTYAEDPFYERFIDLNNDGLLDWMWVTENGGILALMNNEGVFEPTPTGHPWNWAFGSSVNIDGESVPRASEAREWYVDMDGDGLVDRIWEPEGSNDNLYWIKNTGSRFDDGWELMTEMVTTDQGTNINSKTSDGREAFVDLNGDGLPDRIWRPGSGSRGYYVALNTGSGGLEAPYRCLHDTIGIVEDGNFESIRAYSYKGRHEYYADINGDGLTDRFWKPESENSYYVALNDGNGCFHTPVESISSSLKLESWEGKLERLIDLNGDGLPDWIWNPTGTGDDDYYVAINTGDGFLDPESWIPGTSGGIKTASYKGRHEDYVDVTGDGLPDRVWLPEGGETSIFFSANTGVGFAEPQVWMDASITTESKSYHGAREYYFDVEGDGDVDRVWMPDNAGHTPSFFRIAESESNFNRVEEVIAGNSDTDNGHSTRFSYKSSLIEDFHTHNNGKSYTYPINRDNSPRILVNFVSVSDGLEGSGRFINEYTYHEAKAHILGFSDLGFAKTTVKNWVTGIETVTSYNQGELYGDVENPLYDNSSLGRLNRTASSIVTSLNDLNLSRVTNRWKNVEVGIGESARFRLELESSFTQKRDLDGSYLSYETTDFTYDNYGSPKTITSKLYSFGALVREKITENEFIELDSSSYLIPAIEKTTVTVQADEQAPHIAVSSWEYDFNTGKKLKEKILHPSDESIVVKETEFSDIDMFGNHRVTTVRGADFSERSSSVAYDSTGRYIESVTDENGNSSSATYYLEGETNAGKLNVSTDINGFHKKHYYDEFGRLYRSVSAFGTSSPLNTYQSYQWCSEITEGPDCVSYVLNGKAEYRITSYTEGGTPSFVFMDKLGREVKRSSLGLDGRVVNVLSQYNVKGQNFKVSDPFYSDDPIYYTTVKFDTLNRVVESESPDGSKRTITFNGLTRVSTNYFPGEGSQKKTEFRNVMNQVYMVIDNESTSVIYSYNSFGGLRAVNYGSPSESVTSISYDELGRKVEVNDLNKGRWLYSYNGLGELITQTNAKSETTCIVFDSLGRKVRQYDNYGGFVSHELGVTDDAKNDCANAETSYDEWIYDQAPGSGIGKLHRIVSHDGNYEQVNRYDSYGRTSSTEELIGGVSYLQNTTYDQFHRVDTVTYPGQVSRAQVKNVYNNLGFQIQIEDANDQNNIYHSLIAVDAQGNVLEEILGNGVKTTREFNVLTNRVEKINSWLPTDWAAPSIQELVFDFDLVGNLELRTDLIQNISETFEYDELNRLKDMFVDFGNGDRQETNVTYDDYGNIETKTGVGDYAYGGTCNGITAGPNAVTSILSPKNSSYCYDANGNMLSGDGRTIQYSIFDKPTYIYNQGNDVSTTISYSPNRSRYARVDSESNGATTYHYALGIHERISKPNGEIEERNFIGGFAIITNTIVSNTVTEASTSYLHKDHLGSITVITDEIGRIEEEFSFDPWGKRRVPNLHQLETLLGDWTTLGIYQQANLTVDAYSLRSGITNRGFTGHEQMDGVGLIHMNGRVYDSEIGRFVSADPFVQDHTNIQALNRYSYVQNNPLSYTDPSGYFLKNIFNKFVKDLTRRRDEIRNVARNFVEAINQVPGLSTVVGVVIAVYCPPCSAAYYGFLTAMNARIAYESGVPFGQVLNQAAVGFVISQIGGGIGYGSSSAIVGQMLFSGVVSTATGGKFADGVKSALVSAAAAGIGTLIENRLTAKMSSIGDQKADHSSGNQGGFCSKTGKPIHLATGEKYLTMRDYAASGASKLKFERYYSSYKQNNGNLGKGWRTNFDKKLDFSGVEVVAQRERGEEIVFSKSFLDDSETWSGEDGRFEKLKKTKAGWLLVLTNNVEEEYDVVGRLVTVTENTGYTQSLFYFPDGKNKGLLASVKDNRGQKIELEYDYYQRVSSVNANGELIAAFRYDKQDNLVKVIEADSTPGKLADNPYKRYHYDDYRFTHGITRVVNHNGETVHHIEYDLQGRAVLSALGNYIEADRVSYGETKNAKGEMLKINTFTNSLGKRTTYTFDQLNNPLKVTGHATENCVGANQGYAYDDNGLLISKVDWNGEETQYQYNDRGLETLRTEAVGTPVQRTIETSWHSEYRLPVKVVEAGKTTFMEYSRNGLLISKTIRDTASANERTLAQKLLGQYDERSWSYGYSDSGLLMSVDGPRNDVNDVARFEYDAQGNQVAVINALGHRAEVTAFNSRGLPLVVKDVNGIETHMAYDARGWLTSSTRITGSESESTTYRYKKESDYLGAGLIEQVTLPNKQSIYYEYDVARRVIAQSNDRGERIEFTLDAQGNRIAETVFDAIGNVERTHNRVFDELSRLLKSVGAYGETLSYSYDAAGNQSSAEDALGRKTGLAYDALNRLISSSDASGTVATQYDAHNRVRRITDQRGLTTEYRYNGFGDKVAQISPDTGTTVFSYNAAGNAIEKVDARGEITRFTYDSLNRVTDVLYPSANEDNIHYVYDRYENFDTANDDYIVGRLAEVRDASGHSYYSYNHRGQVTAMDYRIGESDYKVAYHYGAKGNLERVIYPGGRAVHYQQGENGTLSNVATTFSGQSHTLARDFRYQAFGSVAGFEYGNGSELGIQRDQNYRITDIRVLNAAANDAIYDVGFVYDLASNIKSIRDAVAPTNSQRFEYDDSYRLTQAKGQYGEINYAYDGVGNRLSRELVNTQGQGASPVSTIEAYEYAQNSNRLLSVVSVGNDGVSKHRDLTYDPVGNIVNDAKSDNEKALYYGARNRLEKVAIGTDGKEAHYAYNAKGQRVSKTVDGVVTHFHYDIANRLIAETSEYNSKEFIYAAGQRIAMVDYSQAEHEQVLFVVNDHLGTPQMLLSMDEDVVWQMNASPFGELTLADTGVKQPLRFPGQYGDLETGYSYNYFRDYDASLGRYIQSDPIGLNGGVNTFAYVSGNPFAGIDPNGLQTQWSNGDALSHYRNNGGNVTLRQIGHLSTIRNSSVTQGALGRFGSQINAKAYSIGSANGAGSYNLKETFNNSYDFTSDKFFIGGGTLSGDFSGTLTVDSNGLYSFSGDAKINFSDTFTDPYDIFDIVPGEWNPDGTPFDITDQWAKPYSGGGICP